MARALAVPDTVENMHNAQGLVVGTRALARPTQRAKYGLSGAGRMPVELRSKPDPNHARAYLQTVAILMAPKFFPHLSLVVLMIVTCIQA